MLVPTFLEDAPFREMVLEKIDPAKIKIAREVVMQMHNPLWCSVRGDGRYHATASHDPASLAERQSANQSDTSWLRSAAWL